MFTNLDDLFGQASQYSTLTLTGSIQRGKHTIAHTSGFVGLLSDEVGVRTLLHTGFVDFFNELTYLGRQVLSSSRLGRLADKFVPVTLTFRLEVTAGELEFGVLGGIPFDVPFNVLTQILPLITPSLVSGIFEEIQQRNAAAGIVFDRESHGYVYRGRRQRSSDPEADLIADVLETLFGPGFNQASRGGFRRRRTDTPDLPEGYYLCRHCSQPHLIANVVEHLKQLRKEGVDYDLEKVSSFYPSSVVEALIADNAKNSPWGKYPCVDCLDFHDLESDTFWDASAQEVRSIPPGQYPTREGGLAEVPDGQFWDFSTRELAEVPEGSYVEDGVIKSLPEGTAYNYTQRRLFATTQGKYWDVDAEMIADIPAGQYVDFDGDLEDLPAGTTFDYSLNGLKATERGKYWDVDQEEVLDIPDGSYLNEDGAVVPLPENTAYDYDKNRLVSTLVGSFFNVQTYQVEPIPEGQYVTADGELDTLPAGLYPDAGGNLLEVPTGQRWNTATGSLEPVSEIAAEAAAE